MTGFVLKLEDQLKRCFSEGMSFTDLQTLKQQIQTKIFLFANFLQQPLELWMFVPCKLVDGVWVVLEEPLKRDYNNVNINNSHYKKYQEAKDRVLFEGFYYKSNTDQLGFKWEYITNGKHYFSFEQIKKSTVEGLLIGYKDEFKIELTQNAQKQFS